MRAVEEKQETLEALREGAQKEIERAMLRVQRELAVSSDEKALSAIARNLRNAWQLLNAQAFEIGGMRLELRPDGQEAEPVQ
jgi:hypothetical protein